MLDLTANIAGPFCTLVLADLGATVVKVEEPRTGDATRSWSPSVGGVSTTFAALNRGKRSIALDLRRPPVAPIRDALITWADVVVSSLKPGSAEKLGLGPERVAVHNPEALYVDISAYGREGPMGGQPGYDAVIQAYSGLMDLTGEPTGPPVRLGTGMVDFGTGLWAALGAVCGLLARPQNHGGHVEVSMLGTAMSFMMHHVVSSAHAGVVPRRLGSAQHNAAPYELVQAADGPVLVAAANDHLFNKFCDALDHPEWTSDMRFGSNSERVANRAQLVNEIESVTRAIPGHEVVTRLRRVGVPASEIASVGDLAHDPQVEALRLVQHDENGSFPRIPLVVDSEPAQLDSRVPTVGGDTDNVLRRLGFSDAQIGDLRVTGAISDPATEGTAR